MQRSSNKVLNLVEYFETVLLVELNMLEDNIVYF